jgi:uncharacterized protein
MRDTTRLSRRDLLAGAGATAASIALIGPDLTSAPLSRSPESGSSTPGKAPIIDAHSHMLMDGDAEGKKRRNVSDLSDVNLPGLFKKMDELGIERTVTVVQETRRVWEDWTGTNQITMDLQERFPERFVGVFGAEPLDRHDVLNRERLAEFRDAARNRRIKGLWFGPPYSHFFANDRWVYPFYEVALENDIVVYFHHGGGIGGGGGKAYRAPLKYARPILLDDVVIDFPDLRIHVEHMAYPSTEILFAIMKHAPYMYTDVCELFTRPTILAWYLMMAKEYGVIDRIVWGSDFDIYWYKDFSFSRYAKKVQTETSWIKLDLNRILTDSGWPTLTQHEIDGILGNNARKLLRIE